VMWTVLSYVRKMCCVHNFSSFLNVESVYYIW